MDPGTIFVDEVFQEDGCGDGSRRASTDVFDVSDIRNELRTVLFVQGQTPDALTRVLTGIIHALVEVIVVGEGCRDGAAQGNNGSAGQGGDIHQYIGVVILLNIGQGVTENQTAFGIGVQDFDGFT